MTVDDVKKTIEQRTGVPAHLLTGETAEEAIAQAKALIAYRNEHEAQRPKHTREQFAEWLQAQQGVNSQDATSAALAEIEEAARVEAGGYPMTKDSGEVTGLPDARTPREQFADWMEKQMAFNPFETHGSF